MEGARLEDLHSSTVLLWWVGRGSLSSDSGRIKSSSVSRLATI